MAGVPHIYPLLQRSVRHGARLVLLASRLVAFGLGSSGPAAFSGSGGLDSKLKPWNVSFVYESAEVGWALRLILLQRATLAKVMT